MKGFNSIGMIVLAIWLIAEGIVGLFHLTIPSLNLVLPLIAILAGVLLLLKARDPKALVNLGYLLLSIWLILTGLLPLLNVGTPELIIVMAVLGLVAGVMILVGQ